MDYLDFDFDFKKNNKTGVNEAEDVDAVQQSILNIVFTRKGDKPFHPRFGSGIYKYLFDKANVETALNIQTEIEFALQNWEPRIIIQKIEATPDPDNKKIAIDVFYKYIRLDQNRSFNFDVKLV